MPQVLRESRMPLPALLAELIAAGRWKQPDDPTIYAAVPFLREPVDFLLSEAQMRGQSMGQCLGLPHFREHRSSESTPKPLPWLDDDFALFIAVNREIGADIAIALDFRSSMHDPEVVASDWWSGDQTCYWRQVAPTFSEFVRRLSL